MPTPVLYGRRFLPELPATAEVLQLAQQIRALAGDGHCDQAWGLWYRLDVTDHSYAIALREGGSMASCGTRQTGW